MTYQKTTFQDSLNKFEDLLSQFENEIDPLMKGIHLGGLYKQQKVLNDLIECELSTIDKRRMRSALNPKLDKFKQLEKDLLIEADLIFFGNQLKDFKTLSQPYYQEKGNDQEMKICFRKFFLILNSYKVLKDLNPQNEKLRIKQDEELKNLNEVVKKFQAKFQRDLLEFKKEEENKKKKEEYGYISSSSTLDQTDEEEISNIPSIQNEEMRAINYKKQGSFLQDIHLSNEHPKEDQQQLQMLKQQLQSELAQKQREQLLVEEQEQKEMQQEINHIFRDLQVIDSMMSDVAKLIHGQDDYIQIMETNTETTLKTLQEAEQELQGASKEQVKYRSKLYSIQGAAFGGGIGFFLGGPIGTALGGLIGGTVGKYVGSTSSKKTI